MSEQKSRRNKVIVAAAVGFLVLIVGMTFMFDIGLGGTIWQFQFAGNAAKVNGVFAPSVANPIYFDPDGNPTPNFQTGTWTGQLPGISVSYDVPGRCDASGNALVWDAPPSDSYEVTVNSTCKEKYGLYYYRFGYVLSTVAKAYTSWNQFGVQFSTYEAGSVNVELTFTVHLYRSIFSNITAWMADCRIIDQKSNLDGYDLAALSWALTPAVNAMQEKGSLVSLLNEQRSSTDYSVQLYAHSILTGGLCIAGANLNRFDVQLQRVLMIGILMKQPLTIGTGSTQTTTIPPKPLIPLDLLTLLLLVFGLAMIVIVTVMAFKYLPGILGAARGRK